LETAETNSKSETAANTAASKAGKTYLIGFIDWAKDTSEETKFACVSVSNFHTATAI